MITSIIAATPGYAATASPSIQRDASGILWSSWLTGVTDSSMIVSGSVSLFLSGQWTTPTVILPEGNASGAPLLSTLALVGSELWAIYGWMTAAQRFIDLKYRVLTQSNGIVSVGAEQTFSIVGSPFLNTQAYAPVITFNGKLLTGVVAAVSPSDPPIESDFSNYCLTSSDGGATWTPSAAVATGLEPQIASLGGKLLMVLRSSKIAVAQSMDGGATWGSVVQSTLNNGDNRVRARMITGGIYDGMLALSSTNNASDRLSTTTWIVSAWTGTDFTVAATILWSNTLNPYRQSYPDAIIEGSSLQGIVGITSGTNLTILSIQKSV